ncbi:MAG: hypothetical protein JNN13_20545 [Planctomycetes bacterium]|nr:hypothetical protein [Planctomycetota bacterium]
MSFPLSLTVVVPAGDEGAGSSWSAWFEAHGELLGWMFVGSIASAVLMAALLPVVVLRLPVDYFAPSRQVSQQRRSLGAWFLLGIKNLIGAVFLVVGLIMVILPGQGILTMFVGLLLVDLPGKRGLERRMVSWPVIRGYLDRLRRRHDKPPFVLD